MNSKKIEETYHKYKDIFHSYIKNIKNNMEIDIYNIMNPTLIKNPYASDFPKRFFINNNFQYNYYILFIVNIIVFYLKNFYLLVSYFISFLIYKIFYKKDKRIKSNIVLDIFILVDNVIKDKKFQDNYLADLYNILKKYKINYSILVRPYGVSKNPFKLIEFFKIINSDDRNFIFEYQFLTIKDFLVMFLMILIYPFKTLRLLQKKKSEIDKIFNYSLIYDLKYFNFNGLTRYILGRKIADIKSIKKIFSWSEFQVVERSFNFAIKTKNNYIEIIALQLHVVAETYFNNSIESVDVKLKTAPHKVIVNGKYFLKSIKGVDYINGVSLRYKNIYLFKEELKDSGVLLLGSYLKDETIEMLSYADSFDNVVFKSHPAVDYKLFDISNKISVTEKNIYELFKNVSIVISTESGTLVEAVSCGISVIVIASKNNLTANPLAEYGKGKIWDIVFEKNDIKKVYEKLILYREKNKNEIIKISDWYKDNFFVEPTEENIVKVFELDKE